MICQKSVSHSAVETTTLTRLGELRGLSGQEKQLMFAAQEFFPLSRFALSTNWRGGSYLKTAHRMDLRQKMPPCTSQEMAEATPLGERQDYLAHYKELEYHFARQHGNPYDLLRWPADRHYWLIRFLMPWEAFWSLEKLSSRVLSSKLRKKELGKYKFHLLLFQIQTLSSRGRKNGSRSVN